MLCRSIIFASLLFSFSSLSAADNKSLMDGVIKKWIDAVNSGNDASFNKLYNSKEFLFANEFNAKVSSTPQDLSEYLSFLKKSNAQFSLKQSVSQMFGDVGINTAIYTVTYEYNNQKNEAQCRSTTVYKKSGGDFLIVNQHSSKIPDGSTPSSAQDATKTEANSVSSSPAEPGMSANTPEAPSSVPGQAASTTPNAQQPGAQPASPQPQQPGASTAAPSNPSSVGQQQSPMQPPAVDSRW